MGVGFGGCMVGCWSVWIVVVVICFMVGDVIVVGWCLVNFCVYSGDYNGDGQLDFYLKVVILVVVVGGEVVMLILFLLLLKNVVLLCNGVSYSVFYDLLVVDLNVVVWMVVFYQSFIGDLNCDGIFDLVLQLNDFSDLLLIVSGNFFVYGVLQVVSGIGLGIEIGYDVGVCFVFGDWLGNGGISI